MPPKSPASIEQDISGAVADATLRRLNEELARKTEELQTANNALAEQERHLKHAISELHRNKRHLAEAQSLGRMGSVGVDLKTKQVFWSDEAARIYGYPAGTEPTAELILQRSHPDDLDALKAVLERAMHGGCDFDWEHRLLMPDGSIKYLHDVAHCVKNAAGDEEIVGAVMDITERKHAAEALRVSEHLARGQLDALVATLAELAREPKPVKFLERVYHVICKQLGAVGLAGWEITSQTGGIKLIATYEDGSLLFPTPQEMQVARAPGLDEAHPIWVDLWANGESCVYCRTTGNPLAVKIARLPDGDWHDSLSAFAKNPVMEKRVRSRLEKGIIGSLVVPTVVSGKVNGCYFIWFRQHRPFRKEEIALTRALVYLATLAHQLYRLLEESRETGTMNERNRLAREIHDTLAQGFTGVIMQLEAAKDAMQREDWSAMNAHVERAGKQARVSLGDARRSVVALRPHTVRDGQFRSALEELMRRLTDGSGVQAVFRLEGEERPLAQDWTDNLLRIAQEALNNTLKYAKAKTFRATLKYFEDRTEFHLVDDGRGFEIGEPHDGYGLIGMRERVNVMKGRFSLQSGQGQGTEISIVLDECSS